MLDAIIIVFLLILTFLVYRMLTKPDYMRIINKLGSDLWMVDKTGVGEGASFYIRFGEFGRETENRGKVHFMKLGRNKEFEYESDLEWSGSESSLRVGQMKLTLVPGKDGGVPTIMYLNDIESPASWTAPLREVREVPPKKL